MNKLSLKATLDLIPPALGIILIIGVLLLLSPGSFSGIGQNTKLPISANKNQIESSRVDILFDSIRLLSTKLDSFCIKTRGKTERLKIQQKSIEKQIDTLKIK